MKIVFDSKAKEDKRVFDLVAGFLKDVATLEVTTETPMVIFQDGKSGGYCIKCTISAEVVSPLLDMDAKLDTADVQSFRANRELLKEHNTYRRMLEDAKAGREFNDIIVEYTKDYSPKKPLKIWGGQHRAKAIQEAHAEARTDRHHGFRIFFNLSKQQRTEIALISNTNIAVSNDLFDRLQEETLVGLKLRAWCYKTGLLKESDDFPDHGSKSEKITVKLARTFVTNFFRGKEEGQKLEIKELDRKTYEPYLCGSGANLDLEYEKITKNEIWEDKALLNAGKAFVSLHKRQFEAVKQSKTIKNLKSFRNKALTESVISAWAFVAGILQKHPGRLSVHFTVPKTDKSIPDPLNAREMSTYRHESDDPTYRGLGTRSDVKDRQRMTQVFLARSLSSDSPIDSKLMDKAVSQVVGLKSLQKGYSV